jgi:hypothetical protein
LIATIVPGSAWSLSQVGEEQPLLTPKAFAMSLGAALSMAQSVHARTFRTSRIGPML